MTPFPNYTRGAERARPRRSVTPPKVTATRRGSHALRQPAPAEPAEPVRSAPATGRIRISPNAIMASRGTVDLDAVKRLARSL